MPDTDYYTPPPGPPPLLNQEQLASLVRYGWINYDLPQHLREQVTRLNELAGAFFAKPFEHKDSIYGIKSAEEHGYYDVPGEKEYITFRRSTGSTDELERQVESIWNQFALLMHRVLCDLSRSSGLDVKAWDRMLESSKTFPDGEADLKNVTTLLRVFRYEPAKGIAEQHTDLGLLTLCVGNGAGLEAMRRSNGEQTWHDASDCSILVGETLRRLSQNTIRPGVHRVVANPHGRQSLVFALRPDLRTMVDLKGFGAAGEVSMRDMFSSIKGSKFNVNAKHEIRKEQKDKQEQQRLQKQKVYTDHNS